MTSYRKKDAATVLEKGEYVIRLGNSSRNTRVCGILRLSSEIITEKHSHICKIPMHVTELEQKEEDIFMQPVTADKTGEEDARLLLKIWKKFEAFR